MRHIREMIEPKIGGGKMERWAEQQGFEKIERNRNKSEMEGWAEGKV